MNVNEYKSSDKWKSVLTELGHPQVGSWDDKTFKVALYRGSKERKALLNWLAPKILECSGRSKKFPDEIALSDVYSQFVFMKQQEIESFLEGSLVEARQVDIWRSVFYKIDLLWDRPSDASSGIPPEDQVLINRAQQALQKAEEVLSKPLPQVANISNPVPPAGNHEVVHQDGLLDVIKNFYQEAKNLNMDPAAANDSVNLTTLKTLSEMVLGRRSIAWMNTGNSCSFSDRSAPRVVQVNHHARPAIKMAKTMKRDM